MERLENLRAKRKGRSAKSDRDPSARIKAVMLVVLLTCAFVSTIAYGAVDQWATGMLAIFGAVIVSLWSADASKSGRLTINLSPLYFPLTGLVLIGVVQMLPLGFGTVDNGLLPIPASSALTLEPYATRMLTIRLVVLLIFLAAAYTFIDSKKKIKYVAWAIILFGAAMAFFGILQRLSGAEAIYGLRKSPQAIPFGPFVNQHHFAALMEMTAGLALGILAGRGVSRELRIVLGLAAAVMGIGVIFTGSRGGFLSFAGVVVVTAVLSYLKSRNLRNNVSGVRQMAAFGGAAALFIAVVATAFFLGAGEALFRGLGPGAGDITSGRLHFWSVAWQIFLDHPLLGAGFDAFGAAFTRYDTWTGSYRIEQAHNDYLQTLADGGIAAFACILGFIYVMVRKSLNVIAESADEMRTSIAIGALAGYTGILIHSIFDFPLRTTSNSLFFLLVAVLASVSVKSSGRNASGGSSRD